MSIRDAVQALGIQVHAGLHTGECEIRGKIDGPVPADIPSDDIEDFDDPDEYGLMAASGSSGTQVALGA